MNNGYIGYNNLNEEDNLLGLVNSRRAYLDKVYRTYKYDPEWVRPADWLPITDPAPGEDKFVALLGISEADFKSNTVTIRFAGAYTVDWGDGSVTNHSSNTDATHSYIYNNIPAGTTTSYGLRQVIITVTPQAGQNLTTINLARIPTGFYQPSIYWLDIVARMPNCTSFTIGSTAITFPLLERFRLLESGNITTLVNTFYRCFRLRVVEFPTTLKPVNLTSTFAYCNDLIYAPYIDTSLTTVFSSVFFQCSTLKYIPDYDFSIASNISSAFSYCYSLEYHRGINAPLAATATGVFLNCYSLRYVGPIKLGNVSNLQQFFYGCYALKKIESIEYTGTVTNMYALFYQNNSLLELPPLNGAAFNTSTLTGTGTASGPAQMFYACRSLRSIPPLDLSSAGTIAYMFYQCDSITDVDLTTSSSLIDCRLAFSNCASLKKVNNFTTASVTNFNGMFAECRSLLSVPAFDMSAVTSSTGIDSGTSTNRMLYNAMGLSTFQATGARVNISFQYCKLGYNEIVEVFNNLGTALGTQTVNVRNNPGTSSLTAGDIAIATGKGWTVLT